MVEELKTAIKRLESLPPDLQKDFGDKINTHLNSLEDLRAEIQKGLNSGSKPFDAEEIKRKGRERLKARQHAPR